MPLPMLSATPASGPSAIGTFVDILIHDVLPACAPWVGLIVVIWVACAVITLAGVFIGGGIQELARSYAHSLRCRWDVEEKQLVTADADGARSTITDLDRHRQPRDHHLDDAQPDDRLRGDDPA